MNSLLIFLLDHSGSMGDSQYSKRRTETIAGFNAFLNLMQYRQDDCEVYFTQFDERFRPAKFISLYDVPPLDYDSYNPDGKHTALHDAVLKTIAAVDSHIATLPATERPVNVTFVIQTDGNDNGSVKTVSAASAALSQHKDWSCLFLGIGPHAATEARQLGFTLEQIIRYDSATSVKAFSDAAEAILESLATGRIELGDSK